LRRASGNQGQRKSMLTIEMPFVAMYLVIAAEAQATWEEAERIRARCKNYARRHGVLFDIAWTCQMRRDELVNSVRHHGALLMLGSARAMACAREIEEARKAADLRTYRALNNSAQVSA
jgi:hypothetical protein